MEWENLSSEDRQSWINLMRFIRSNPVTTEQEEDDLARRFRNTAQLLN